MRIDILVGNNSYSSVLHFSKSIARAFEKKGAEVRVFYVGKDRFFEAFYAILKNPPDMTFSFSNVDFGKKSASSVFGVTHFSYLLDPGIYYAHQLSGKAIVSCVDRKDVKLLNAQKQTDENSPIFLPHGVDSKLFKMDKQKAVFDVIMTGTCHDYESLRNSWAQRFSPEVKKVLEMAQEMVLSPQGISCFEALESLCGHIPELQPHMVTLHRELDLYITGKERIDLLRSLDGLDIHVFGKGLWKKYVPKATIHPQASFAKTLKLMNASKIVLNSSPRFKDGSHERVFVAYASHALPLCGLNPFFQDTYKDQENILFYQYGNYQGLKDKLNHYLNQNSQREEMVESGRAVTKACHTWDNRVEAIYTYLH